MLEVLNKMLDVSYECRMYHRVFGVKCLAQVSNVSYKILQVSYKMLNVWYKCCIAWVVHSDEYDAAASDCGSRGSEFWWSDASNSDLTVKEQDSDVLIFFFDVFSVERDVATSESDRDGD